MIPVGIAELFVFLDNIEMEIPTWGGWYHLMWIGIVAGFIAFFIVARKKGITINENSVFGIYGFLALLFEATKQIMWSLSVVDGVAVWDYSWYSAPFQYCSMPMYVAIILVFVKKEKPRRILCSFMAFFSILSTISVLAYPTTCFVSGIIVDIHTMILHAGGVIVSSFILINRLYSPGIKGWLQGFLVFLFCVVSAVFWDILVNSLGWNGEETFNMFYISPYFPSSLPVFDILWNVLPYPLFLLSYIAVFALAGFLINRLFALIDRARDKA